MNSSQPPKEAAKRLRHARINAGFKTRESAVNALSSLYDDKYSYSRYGNYENGIRQFGPEEAKDFAHAFNSSASWILCLDDAESQSIQPTESPVPADIKGLVPVISWIQAGAFCESPDNFQPGDGEEWLPCPAKHSDGTYALVVSGDSMTSPYPGTRSYPSGTIIFVDPHRAAINGSRVIVRLADTSECTFKVLTEDMGKCYLKPLNPQYQTIELPEDSYICGVVIGSYWPE